MGVFDQFPYTNFHELNLEWLIRKMKELEEIYGNLQKEIQEAIDYVNEFEQNVGVIIDEKVAIALSLSNQRLTELENLVKELQEQLSGTGEDSIDSQLAELRLSIENLNSMITFIKSDYISRDNRLIDMLHEYKNSIDSIIDGKMQFLEQFVIEHVTKLDRLDVINPISGLYENIQNVLNDLAKMIGQTYGLTAQQYDELQLTAHTYDSYRIKAEEYSTRGYFELYLKLTQNLMYSPFTGKLTDYDEVINDLADLHKCAYTAAEYDAEQFTAEEFDSLMLTAWLYDWLSFRVAHKVIAQMYDNLKLTAADYDNLNITAEEYERGMQYLINTKDFMHCNNSCNDTYILATQIQTLTNLVKEYEKQVEDYSEQVKSYEPIKYQSTTAYNEWLQAGLKESIVSVPNLKAESYIDIETYDAKAIPALANQDLKNHKITIVWDYDSAEKITAEMYDNALLTAQTYDTMNMTAQQYDSGWNVTPVDLPFIVKISNKMMEV